ncbi:hypothetical protein INT43_004103 [Umbelopsis isabellina]|uniref:Uncharacterized protein n=1 Tax=Mortierella isabellina TaxID=91625 RepID=A0A8H7U9A4_MORIS|nr:hypothetical protein INT43_004103 [Umbelopsis isabellina]
MAAFLRPSDLDRISLLNCIVTTQGDLVIKIIAPKELRAGRRIVKTLVLLVNSKNPTKRLKATTISTWLRNLMRLSTFQKPVPSVRSVASDLALARGAPLSDVVTMGNWSSSEVFDNHDRRQRLQRQKSYKLCASHVNS